MAKQQQFLSLQEDGLYLLDLNKTTSFKLNIPFPLQYPIGPVCFLHCHGMVSLTDLLQESKSIKIWNPNPTPNQTIISIEMVKPGRFLNQMGFGYDPVINDFKIVTIFNQETYIYTLKEKTWKTSKPVPFPGCTFVNVAATVLKNSMYWIGSESNSDSDSDSDPCIEDIEFFILSFDFVKEKYEKSPLPKSMDPHVRFWLGISKGDLCVIHHYPDSSGEICVWRPVRDGNKIIKWLSDQLIHMKKPRSFTSLFSRKCRPSNVRFAWIARNDEIFVLVKGRDEKDRYKILVYNVEEEKFIEVQFGNYLRRIKCVISDFAK